MENDPPDGRPDDRPEPTVEEPELHPGGVDAIVPDEESFGDLPGPPLSADLPAGSNAAAADAPEEVKELDDKPQEPEAEPDEHAPEPSA